MKILKDFNEKGTFIVGGHVRDILLGKESNDIDYVIVGSSIEELLKKGYKLVGKDFPVFLDTEGNEIALARTERKINKGYTGFECCTDNITLKDDLSRRDLTINSIALISENVFFDPFNGIEDLNNKILRHTTEAFKEDPVRVLRLARFYARYKDFIIHEDTKKLVLSLREELKYLTKERVTNELLKVMKDDNPHLFFIALKDLEVLDILFPEIYNMIGCEHNNIYHAEGDVFNHTMKCLEEVVKFSNDIYTRIGVLYHDIAKPISKNIDGNFHNHDSEEYVEEAVNMLKERYRFTKELIKTIYFSAKFHHTFHKLFSMGSNKVVKHFFNQRFPQNEEQFIRLFNVSKADSFGRLLDKNGIIIEGKEDSDYNESLKIFLINAFKEMKKVSAKEFLKDKENPSIDSIQQFLHRERIRIYVKHLRIYKESL